MKASSGLLLLSLLLGCGLPFSRPTPSENEYKERYLDMLDKGQIRDLRFTYDGWVGTASSIARFATDASGIERIRAAAQREETYVPSSEATRRELQSRFERAASPGIPKWFDLPLAKPLVVFVSQGVGDSEGHPPFSYEWYVDEETGTVYFLMVMGDAADDGFGIPQNQGMNESGG